jgi:hypothetical protein
MLLCLMCTYYATRIEYDVYLMGRVVMTFVLFDAHMICLLSMMCIW